MSSNTVTIGGRTFTAATVPPPGAGRPRHYVVEYTMQALNELGCDSVLVESTAKGNGSASTWNGYARRQNIGVRFVTRKNKDTGNTDVFAQRHTWPTDA